MASFNRLAPFNPIREPTPAEIKLARLAAGLSQQRAAELVGRKDRKRWSEWERGERQMQRDTWELFLLLTNLHPALRVLLRAA